MENKKTNKKAMTSFILSSTSTLPLMLYAGEKSNPTNTSSEQDTSS